MRATARHRAAKCASSLSRSTPPDFWRTELITATAPRTRSARSCASSQSRVALALRAPSTDPELTNTIWSASASTPAIAECSRPVPQSVSTML